MEKIIGYMYQVWFDGCCIRDYTGDDDCIFDSEEEVREDADSTIEWIIKYEEGYENEQKEDFYIVIIDVAETEEDE